MAAATSRVRNASPATEQASFRGLREDDSRNDEEGAEDSPRQGRDKSQQEHFESEGEDRHEAG